MNRKVILCALVAAIGGFLYGFDTAVINGALPFFRAYFNLDATMTGWAVSSALIGSIIGAISIGVPGDKYGRREMLKLSAILFAISAIGTAMANDINTFIAFRLIGGLAVGAASVLSPMYISEISPAMFRGRLIVTFQLSLVVGILLAFMVDYMLVDTGANNWRYMFISEIFPSILFLILLFFVEKSPRWLVQKDRIEEAKLVIEAIGPEEDAQNLIIQIQNTLSREAGYKTENLFKKGNFKFILLGIAVGLFSQFTGIAIVMYYATDIFRSAGFSTDSAIGQTVVLGLTNLIFTIIAMLLIDKIGRKRLLLTGMLGMSVFLGLFSYSFLGGNLGNLINLILLVGFVAFFASSMGAVVFVLFAEIFPNSIRSRGMAIGSFSNWIVNASITFIFPVFVSAFDKRIGIGYSFAFFSIMTFIGFWVFKKFLFETHNRSLENIEMGNKMI